VTMTLTVTEEREQRQRNITRKKVQSTNTTRGTSTGKRGKEVRRKGKIRILPQNQTDNIECWILLVFAHYNTAIILHWSVMNI